MGISSDRMVNMARRRAGLSQRELADRADVPQATISRIERGHISPTFDTLDRLLAACGMEMVAEDRPQDGDVDRSQIRELLKHTSDERFRAAVQAANATRRFLDLAKA